MDCRGSTPTYHFYLPGIFVEIQISAIYSMELVVAAETEHLKIILNLTTQAVVMPMIHMQIFLEPVPRIVAANSAFF
jgi:hypothetical protein